MKIVLINSSMFLLGILVSGFLYTYVETPRLKQKCQEDVNKAVGETFIKQIYCLQKKPNTFYINGNKITCAYED